eukprot:gnl/TRDRNA2_/TRDRNA2_159067_c2_seq1.p1 gnl/TRDRNA2_/TRDRNA2_159067_c2~~gnl/TRDRNA2_/TRDRNA2_159067_c2_seq1.p1  ORF type:complete len:392 (+),score=80.37 gnl/TRDRNA2_/TRDRNA2_159067_c2_seq1:41-1216(+)
MRSSLLPCLWSALLRGALCGSIAKQPYKPSVRGYLLQPRFLPSICSGGFRSYAPQLCAGTSGGSNAGLTALEEWNDPFKWEDEANVWTADAAVASLTGWAAIAAKISAGGIVKRARSTAEMARKTADEAAAAQTRARAGRDRQLAQTRAQAWTEATSVWEAATGSTEAAAADGWTAPGATNVAYALSETARLAAAIAEFKQGEAMAMKKSASGTYGNEAFLLQAEVFKAKNRAKEWKSASDAWMEAVNAWEKVAVKRGGEKLPREEVLQPLEAKEQKTTVTKKDFKDAVVMPEEIKKKVVKDLSQVQLDEEKEKAQKAFADLKEEFRATNEKSGDGMDPPPLMELLAQPSDIVSISSVMLFGFVLGCTVSLAWLRFCRQVFNVPHVAFIFQ